MNDMAGRWHIFIAFLLITTGCSPKYRAYGPDGKPVGHEMLKYYELNPLEVTFSRESVLVKAGLFVGDSLAGEPWTQRFRTGITD